MKFNVNLKILSKKICYGCKKSCALQIDVFDLTYSHAKPIIPTGNIVDVTDINLNW